ncbi:hypothetical protein H8F21_13805 [Pseudomonas sp. P66]|uniref:Uncharacterized protein n=1 Tax=Pseudomonas arcuscaelestis TaxID=2710591 RepID=A0ABS2BYE0_9PSED|nr:hypothetical protein [Pseudomonas arcuscaelestis]MBM5458640.1 hypothetical protein [Pseudomonas arcuscaelestis]
MRRETIIKTTQTDPDHETIGFTFKGWDDHEYFCDSWESNLGFWMTRVDAPPERRADAHSEFRRNVSERAIGRTFHQVQKIPRRTAL